jgi:hypothetical protein
MRRILILVAAVLGLLFTTGMHWPQGWHWPGPGVGSAYDPTQTWVYFQRTNRDHDLYLRQFAYVDWAAIQWRRSPRLAVRVVERCPAGANCIHFRTRQLAYPFVARTVVGCCDDARHIGHATVTFDIGMGTAQYSTATSREAACFETMLALGGGWNDPATALDEHTVGCNGTGYPTRHDYEALARVYDHLHR